MRKYLIFLLLSLSFVCRAQIGWSNLSSGQWVSFQDMQGSGVPTLHTLPSSSQWMTKSDLVYYMDVDASYVSTLTSGQFVAKNQVVAAYHPAIHSIGDQYGGGTIVFVSGDGHSGLIASNVFLQDNSSYGIRWFNGSNRASISTNNAYGYGKSNTNNILATIGNSGIAAKVCREYNGGGFNDWFLPSLAELVLARSAKSNGLYSPTPGDLVGNTVWTSSQYDAVYAYRVTFSNGDQSYEDDYLQKQVIACRYFTDNVVTYYSDAYSGTAQKECTSGTGTFVTLYVGAGAFTSTTSQTDANNQAIAYVNANKQSYANTWGDCSAFYLYVNNNSDITANSATISLTWNADASFITALDNPDAWSGGQAEYTPKTTGTYTLTVSTNDNWIDNTEVFINGSSMGRLFKNGTYTNTVIPYNVGDITININN